MSSAGKKVGVFAKDAAQGKVADEWKAVYNDVKGKEGFEETDVGPAMGYIWGPKDEAEVGYMRMAAKMTSRVMSTKFVDEISDILDGGKKVTHEKLAGRLEEVLDDDKFWKKAKGLADADMALADWVSARARARKRRCGHPADAMLARSPTRPSSSQAATTTCAPLHSRTRSASRQQRMEASSLRLWA